MIISRHLCSSAGPEKDAARLHSTPLSGTDLESEMEQKVVQYANFEVFIVQFVFVGRLLALHELQHQPATGTIWDLKRQNDWTHDI